MLARYMLGVAALPSFVMFLGCLLLPESPRWLVKHGSVDEARRVLVKIRGNEEVEHELQEMENVIKQETGLQQGFFFTKNQSFGVKGPGKSVLRPPEVISLMKTP